MLIYVFQFLEITNIKMESETILILLQIHLSLPNNIKPNEYFSGFNLKNIERKNFLV